MLGLTAGLQLAAGESVAIGLGEGLGLVARLHGGCLLALSLAVQVAQQLVKMLLVALGQGGQQLLELGIGAALRCIQAVFDFQLFVV